MKKYSISINVTAESNSLAEAKKIVSRATGIPVTFLHVEASNGTWKVIHTRDLKFRVVARIIAI